MIRLSSRWPRKPRLVAAVTACWRERVNLPMSLETGGPSPRVDNHFPLAVLPSTTQVTDPDSWTAIGNGPGALAPTLKLVSDASVNVEYAYGGGVDAGPTAMIVLGVDDAMRASAAAGV